MPATPTMSNPMQPSSIDETPLSPGQQFAAAFAEHGRTARVDFPVTITEQFPGFSRRPRIAMRSLFKVKKTTDAAASYWFETHPTGGAGDGDATIVVGLAQGAFSFGLGRVRR